MRLDAKHTASLQTAIDAGLIAATYDDYDQLCYAPALGDGLNAEIFRLWVDLRASSAAWPNASTHVFRRYTILDAGQDFAIVYESDDVAGAITALVTMHAVTQPWIYHVAGYTEV